MARNGRKWVEWLEVAGNGWEWLDITRKTRNGCNG